MIEGLENVYEKAQSKRNGEKDGCSKVWVKVVVGSACPFGNVAVLVRGDTDACCCRCRGRGGGTAEGGGRRHDSRCVETRSVSNEETEMGLDLMKFVTGRYPLGYI